jgi:ketosteroid isomerase-like protein
MSRENVEIVEKAWEAWNRGDLQAVLSFYDPQAEVDFSQVEGRPGSSLLRGVSEFERFLTDWRTTWDSHRVTTDTLLDAGGDRVIALVREYGRGRGSGRRA